MCCLRLAQNEISIFRKGEQPWLSLFLFCSRLILRSLGINECHALPNDSYA